MIDKINTLLKFGQDLTGFYTFDIIEGEDIPLYSEGVNELQFKFDDEKTKGINEELERKGIEQEQNKRFQKLISFFDKDITTKEEGELELYLQRNMNPKTQDAFNQWIASYTKDFNTETFKTMDGLIKEKRKFTSRAQQEDFTKIALLKHFLEENPKFKLLNPSVPSVPFTEVNPSVPYEKIEGLFKWFDDNNRKQTIFKDFGITDVKGFINKEVNNEEDIKEMYDAIINNLNKGLGYDYRTIKNKKFVKNLEKRLHNQALFELGVMKLQEIKAKAKEIKSKKKKKLKEKN